MRSRISALLGFALVTMICLPSITMAELSKKDADTIRKSSQEWMEAVQARDWIKLAALYTDDAVLLPPNMPAIEGRESIQAHFASLPPLSGMKLDIVEVNGAGGFAYVWGSYSMTIAMEGAEPVKDEGKYIEIRRKGKDGAWPIFRDMYSSDLGGAEQGKITDSGEAPGPGWLAQDGWPAPRPPLREAISTDLPTTPES